MLLHHFFVMLFGLCLILLIREIAIGSGKVAIYSIGYDAEMLVVKSLDNVVNSFSAGSAGTHNSATEGLALQHTGNEAISINTTSSARTYTDSSSPLADEDGMIKRNTNSDRNESAILTSTAYKNQSDGVSKVPSDSNAKKGYYLNGTRIIPAYRRKRIARVDRRLKSVRDAGRYQLLHAKQKDPDDPFPCPSDLSYTINGTRVSKCRKHPGGDALVVDIVSIGSKHRLHYLEGQYSTWASHLSVRNFFAVTEEDDADPFCELNMTPSILRDHNDNCRQSHDTRNLFVHRFMPLTFVVGKPNPFGWLCAQVRPGTALGKVARYYKTLAPSQLPDYLMLVDDDTMVRMDYFVEEMNKYNSSVARAWAGCLQVKNVGKNNVFRFSPFGGAGTYFSKGSLQRLLTPLHCNRDNSLNDEYTNFLCRQIVRRNEYLNLTFKEDGLTLAEHAYNYFNEWPNCYVSDWLVAHYINYFNLSIPWDDVDSSSHLHPYRRSFMEMDDVKVKRFSRFQDRGRGCECNDGCHDVALPVCHYVGPDEMRNLTSQWLSLEG